MSREWDPGRIKTSSKLHAYSRLIRIEHTLFSLPFAYVGMVLSGYSFGLREVLLASLAVFGLRTAAMAYNNIADLDIDRLNPRSRGRPLVTGAVGIREAWMLVALGSLIYYLSAYLLNIYAFLLSPLLWAVAIYYPYAKRLHWLPHLHLGLSLSMVVLGGSVAVSGSKLHSLYAVLRDVPWLFLIGVVFWVSGFDIYYSVLDYDFDRSHGLGSAPARLGVRNAVVLGATMHALSLLFFWTSICLYGLGFFSVIVMGMATLLLALEAYLAYNGGADRIRRAFNINLIFSLLVTIGIIVDKIA